MSIIFVSAFSAMATGIGLSLIRMIDSSGRLSGGERLGLAFFFGCLVVNFGVASIGPFRLDKISMGALGLVLVLLSAPGLKSMPWRQYILAIRGEFCASGSIVLLWTAIIAVGLSSLLQGMAPPNDYDSLMYHLALPRYDVELGRMEIPWDRGMPLILLPAFGGNLSRFALVLADDGAAQMIHGLFGLLAALGSAMLVRRLGSDKRTALLAALLFLSVRVVVWEMATVETDFLCAAATVMALCVYLSWRDHPETGTGILFGLLIGGAVLTKLHGFVFAAAMAPLVLYDMARDRRIGWRGFIGPLVAGFTILPHITKMYLLTGNPLFPKFGWVFTPGKPKFFSDFPELYGTGRGLVDLLTAPWNFSVLPMHYFDGMVLGAPYLLAFCPLLLLDPNRRRWLAVLLIALIFYVIWFFMLSQQVRFLAPIVPLMTGVAAVGVVAFWRRCRNTLLLKAGFAVVTAVLALNQAMFIGAYAALRLPPAFGLMTAADFHARTPTMTGAHFRTCTYIANNLKPGERYFSNTGGYLSYYCPQVPVVRKYFPDEAKWWMETDQEPKMSLDEFVRRADAANFRYFIVTTRYENRRNVSAKPVLTKEDPSVYRFGVYLEPVLNQLEPLSQDSFTAVYDGADVIRLMKLQTKK